MLLDVFQQLHPKAHLIDRWFAAHDTLQQGRSLLLHLTRHHHDAKHPCGQRWPMAGLAPGETQMQRRLAGLGYRVAMAVAPHLLLTAGEEVRGHEFHYSTWIVSPARVVSHTAWALRRRPDDSGGHLDGYVNGNLLASYLHIHFGQRPALAARFVMAMGNGD